VVGGVASGGGTRRDGRGALLGLSLLAACGRVPPADLIHTTPWELARSRGRFVSVDQMSLFEITLGQGPDLVLIHGNASSSYTWRKIIEPLATRYRVHALDLPGFGMSAKPDDASYDTPWLAQHVIGYLDAVGVTRAALVGSSMGGYVATVVALAAPTRVASLVLLGPSGLPGGEDGEATFPASMLAWPVIGPVLQSLPARGLVRARMRDAYYDPSLVTETDVDVVYSALRSRGGANGYVGRMRQRVPPDRVERVRRLTAPTLVVTGDTDRVIPPATAARYHELIAGSELMVLEQTGHLPQEERPERTLTEIARWVDGHP
jgi:pimeloyl-ACP methyl ester carboxylesterase